MISSLNIHNIKISLKLQIPYQSYFAQKTKQIKSLKFKNTLNFLFFIQNTLIYFLKHLTISLTVTLLN